MNVLVTGGCGFIGSHFIKRLVLSGQHNVVNIDRFTYPSNMINLLSVCESNNFSHYTGSPISNKVMSHIMNNHKIDIVVNFDRHISVVDLASVAKEEGVQKLIHISSVVVLNPTNEYADSKFKAERQLLRYNTQSGFPVVVVRLGNIYGPNQYPNMIVPVCITRLLDGKKIRMEGEGVEVREYVYVSDTCKAINILMDYGSPLRVYNVGSGNMVSTRQLIEIIVKSVVGSDGVFEDYVESVPNRKGSFSLNVVSCDWRELFRETHFYEGLSRTIAWYKKNYPSWWS